MNQHGKKEGVKTPSFYFKKTSPFQNNATGGIRMGRWYMTEAKIDYTNPNDAVYQIGSVSKFIDSYGAPNLSVEFRHRGNGMVKRYNNVPLTPALESGFRDIDWTEMQHLIPEAMEEGFIALDGRDGVVYCNRNLHFCNQECCLYHKCELGIVKKMTEKG